jgi:chromosome segregation ATPase
MFRTPVLQFLPCSVLLAAALSGVARSQDLHRSPSASSYPAQTPATAGESPAPAEAPEKKKPKKVWTNDELKSVKGGVSVVGDTDKDKQRPASTNAESQATDVHRLQVENYRKQIQQFREQIEAADKRIAQLKGFKAEDTSASGGINLHQIYNMVPLEEQVKQLESKKKQLQERIAEMEAEARKNGIEPGELR